MISRRQFITNSAIAAGSAIVLPTIIPSCVKGANDKINLGMIGTGDHGITWNLAAYLKLDNCRVVAACDVDSERVGKAKAMIDSRYKNKDCVEPRKA